ncbi:MAG: signal peptidase II [Armatimonadota bacterium]
MKARVLTSVGFYGIALAVAVVDQLVKARVLASLPEGDFASIPLWPGVFHLTHVHNRGAAFSMLEGRLTVIVLAGLLIAAAIVATERRAKGRLPRFLGVALALPLGGALGNLIDRVRFGYVVDFLDFRLIHFPIFNVADSAITIGIGLLLVRSLFADRAKDPSPTHAPLPEEGA